jgi:glycosyltransferase involved in cell wall biosynthesis
VVTHKGRAVQVLMVVENSPYLRDTRVRKEARALLAAGYDVSVISPKQVGESWHQVKDGVSLYRFPVCSIDHGFLGYLMEYACGMLGIMVLSVVALLRENFDIIHVANPPDCLVPLLSVYKLAGKLVIFDQHDLSPELYSAKFEGSRLVTRLMLSLEWYSYKLANHVIVTNESYKKLAMRRGLLRESEVTVVRNGPDLRSPSWTEIDLELREKSPNIIAFAGVTGFQDGLDYLCQSLHHLRYSLHHENFYCVILGDGDALPAIKSLARELLLDDKIWFVGWVSDPDAYMRYISTADICVAPEPSNTYNDRSTFVKILEYMNAGKPIVAFDLPETRHSAQTAALYADPNDVGDFAQKLADLMEKPSLQHSMGKSGYQQVQNELAWPYSVPNLLSVYKKVIQSHPAVERSPAGQRVC